jgi:hypothetical protein
MVGMWIQVVILFETAKEDQKLLIVEAMLRLRLGLCWLL